MDERFPFLTKKAASELSDFEADRINRIEKVRAWHEDRERYEATIGKFPEHRIAIDKGERNVSAPKKVARSNRGESKTKIREIKQDEQIGLF